MPIGNGILTLGTKVGWDRDEGGELRDSTTKSTIIEPVLWQFG